MLAFVRYLPKEKFDISVVTLLEGKAAQQEEFDSAKIYREENKQVIPLKKQIQGESRLKHYAKVVWNVLVHKLLPYPHAGWMKLAVKRLEDIQQKQKIDLVISSFSPVEAHVAAYKFLMKHAAIQWIADMRDEMASNGQIPESTRQRLRKVEQLINQRAQAITTVSAPILRDMQGIMSRVEDFVEIRNGYDHQIPSHRNFNSVFTIVYAGTFYGQRKPGTFFEGLKQFLQKHPIDFRIRFVGTHHNFHIPAEFVERCEFVPPVSNDEAVRIMADADATLLILPEVESKGVYSGKIFDYLSVMKPIIAVVDPTDVAAELILELNAGFVANFNDADDIELAIESTWKLWKEQKHLPIDSDKIKSLHRKFQVEKLEQLCIKLVRA